MLTQFMDPALRGFQLAMPTLDGCALVAAPIADYQAELFAAERCGTNNMATARLLAYSCGRHCAHLTQQLLGLSIKPVIRQQRRPIWPAPSVGSITHSRKIAAAFASKRHRSVGIDLENAGRVTRRLFSKVFTSAEIDHLEKLPALAPSILFSAKEAGYKAIYPIGQEYIGFMQAQVQLTLHGHAQQGSFVIDYLGEHPPNKALNSGIGYWSICDGHVMTLFLIP